MTRLREVMASGASYFVRVTLFLILVPTIMAAIQLVGPYEDAHQLPIKVIKLGENNQLHLTWCCRGPDDGVVDYDRYLSALRKAQGVIESGGSHSRYSVELAGSHDITVVLHSGGDVFVYVVRGGRLYPLKRKVLDAWKVAVSLMGAMLIVFLATRVVQKIKEKRPPIGRRESSG